MEQKARLGEVIWVDPERMSGTPCFKGTRVPVQNLLDYIEGSTIDEFFQDYPSVTREQVIQFLELGKEQLLECVPARLKRAFPGHAVQTVTESEWRTRKDGPLRGRGPCSGVLLARQVQTLVDRVERQLQAV